MIPNSGPINPREYQVWKESIFYSLYDGMRKYDVMRIMLSCYPDIGATRLFKIVSHARRICSARNA